MGKMGLKSDAWIINMAMKNDMIEPFVATQIRYIDDGSVKAKRVVSYGTSSYGYDMRVADEFKIFTNVHSAIVDPKHFREDSMVDFVGDICTIPPNSFALGRSVEYFRMPTNVMGIVLGKSTYARCGIVCNVTPMEPEWEGYLTIEISNTTPLPARVYANEGIAQVLFFEGDGQCLTTYADRRGKYQAQRGVTPARM
jgi:dCTP deaminase